ncbi:hypothetical protein TELCIR_08394 [Teladorsagia circumcincta]|uniref:DUF1279 domain-containing protein n=1 Tax=Teladorsagia circumcincta TaxID=45464 RepID=A0A2G9UHQ9_TELCI|nr:hypothetical protein TELCIR_08394 [Teladorsagia circumcincta]
MYEQDMKKHRWPFHVTMTEEQKQKKQEKIEKMKEEKEPDTLFGKVKYYLKRYWYIAVPAHMVATPLRYMTTLALIQATFWTLRRMGKLRTAREVEYKVRTEYEKSKIKYGRKLYRYRNMGVRDVLRKNQSERDGSNKSDRKD